MKSRNLKPGFFKNDQLAKCGPWARLLYEGLWCMADREGRLEERPMLIKAEVFPYDPVEIDPPLQELADNGLIIRYEIDGKWFIAIPKFLKHQYVHPRDPESVIPPPPVKNQSKGKPGRPRKSQDSQGSPKKSSPFLNTEYGIVNVEVPASPGAAPEGLREPAKVDPLVQAFEDRYRADYAGKDYPHKRGDFVQLAKLKARVSEPTLTEQWPVAVSNYFATLREQHTLAELSVKFDTFYLHPLDRFGKPVGSNGAAIDVRKETRGERNLRERAERYAREDAARGEPDRQIEAGDGVCGAVGRGDAPGGHGMAGGPGRGP